MAYLICGLDEVGRGALAGPILAVAALFEMPAKQDWVRKNSPINGVNDSKAFSDDGKRREVYSRILRHATLLDFGIGIGSVSEINLKGIDEANRLAFIRAWSELKKEPSFILVDGNRPVPAWNYSLQEHRPRGDSLWWPVGAASILAKTIRDDIMRELGAEFPHYGWNDNAGYGTTQHSKALQQHGPCPHHRRQFIEKIMAGVKPTTKESRP